MNSIVRRRIGIGSWSLLVFLLLTIRFCPNWWLVYANYQSTLAHAPSDFDRKVVRQEFEKTYTFARGMLVADQVVNLAAEIEAPSHKIIRWRLLMPAIGHFLQLPRWTVLALGPLGCLALVIGLVTLGDQWSTASKGARLDAFSLGIIAGASAPFFTSMGWLGYYDAWLALALIGVAFVRSRGLVAVACLLAPWIDERFVIGLPLALCVRWTYFERSGRTTGAWFRAEALLPLLLVACYSLVRLKLGGTGGSQTVADYLRDFVFSEQVSLGQRGYGAWMGLRLGWMLILFPVVASLWPASFAPRWRPTLVAVVAAITALVDLFTVQDSSRSVVVVLPVVVLGWWFALRIGWWSKYRVGLGLAIFSLLLPAAQVTSNLILPVNAFWSSPAFLTGVQNLIGVKYLNGDGMTKDSVEAVRLLRLAADHGNVDAACNLGIFYATATGVSPDNGEAARWFRRAAEKGHAQAQANYGVMCLNGTGVPQDSTEGVRWLRTAARQGHAGAMLNLARVFEQGNGVPQDEVEGLAYYLVAAESGSANARERLIVLEQRLGPEKTLLSHQRSKQLMK